MATTPTITGTVTAGAPPAPSPDNQGDSLPLLPGRAEQLDGIIQKMMANKEPDENISAVVKDFKGLYSAGRPPDAPPVSVPKDALDRIGGMMSADAGENNVDPSGHLHLAGALSSPIALGVARASEPGLPNKAEGASMIARGAGRAIAPIALPEALLAAGPAATVGGLAVGTGAQVGTEAGLRAAGVRPEYQHLAGDVAGLAGGMAGAKAGDVAADALTGPANRAAQGAADWLDSSAEKNIATALNPTTRVNKALVANKIAPGLIERKVTATSLKDLQDQAQGQMETHGEAIDDIFDQHADAGTKLSPKPILAALDKEKQAYTVDGEPINPAYVAKLGEFQQSLQRISNANGGDIPLASLRKIRDAQAEIVKQSKGGFALDPDGQSSVNASKTYWGAIRNAFADNVDGLAAENKEFSFWSDVDKVAGDSLMRKTGQRAPLTQKIAEGVGTMAGAKLGGPAGALVGNRVGGMLGSFQNSTLWNTLSARMKTQLADLIAKGDERGALAVAKSAGLVPKTATAAEATPTGVVPESAAGTSQPAAKVPTSGGTPNAATRARSAEPSIAPVASNAPANLGAIGEGQAVRAALPATGAPEGAGAGTIVRVPGKPGPGYQAQYQLRELDDINGSHNGLTFAPNAGYRLVNDRNYGNQLNQRKVVNWSSPAEFDPAFHITDNPDATNGPVVTDADGNVIGGNGRAMILQRVYNNNPKGAAAYRALLTQKAAQFGIDPAAVASMKQPVLTREIAESEFGPNSSKQDAVTDMNKVGTASLTSGERAIADSRRVSTATLDDVAARLDAKGAKATVADVLEGQPGREVLKKLIDDGVVSPQEQAALTTKDGLTKAGRDRIGQLMIGRYFSDSAQMDSIPLAVRAKIERLAAPLAQVEAKGDWNLTPDVQEAVSLVDDAKRAGAASIGDFIQQQGFFGKEHYSPNAVALAKALKNAKSTELTAAARQYAQDAAYADKGESLMGDAPTPKQSFADSFGKLKSGAQSDAARLTPKKDGEIPPGRMMRPFPDVPFDPESATKADVVRGSRVFYRPGKGGQMGTVYVNAQARELLVHVGKVAKDEQFAGYSMPGPLVRQAVRKLDKTILKNEWGVAAVKPLFALRQALQKSLKENGKAILVDAGPGKTLSDVKATIRHELHHAYETDFTPEQAQTFMDDPLAHKAGRTLVGDDPANPHYRDEPVNLVSEIGAHLKEGPSGWETLDLTPDQALVLWRRYVRQYPGHFRFENIHPTLKEAADE